MFYLGAHQPSWLADFDVPLFVSRIRLAGRRTLPRARCDWALDSGGFSELSLRGGWTVSAQQYVAEARRYRDEIGRMTWCAPQDWMCEPMIVAKTGLTVAEHQRRTVENYLDLRELAPELPWAPVLQGWLLSDYLDHIEQYARRGVNLAALPLVGLGSVCRRQATALAETLIRQLHAGGLKLHGFGFKTLGLRRVAKFLASADSMAWSFDARRAKPIAGHAHKNCANCPGWALAWRDRLLRGLDELAPRSTQLSLLDFGSALAGR